MIWEIKNRTYVAQFPEGKVSVVDEGINGIRVTCWNNSGTLELKYRSGSKTLEHYIPKGQESCAPYATPNMQPLPSHSDALKELPVNVRKHLSGNLGLE